VQAQNAEENKMEEFGKDNCYVGVEYGRYDLVMPVTLEVANRLMGSSGDKPTTMQLRLQKTVARLDELLELLEVQKADPSYVRKLADILDGPYQPMIGEKVTVYRNMKPVLDKEVSRR
jgi:hypothetical protein